MAPICGRYKKNIVEFLIFSWFSLVTWKGRVHCHISRVSTSQVHPDQKKNCVTRCSRPRFCRRGKHFAKYIFPRGEMTRCPVRQTPSTHSFPFLKCEGSRLNAWIQSIWFSSHVTETAPSLCQSKLDQGVGIGCEWRRNLGVVANKMESGQLP